MINMKAHSEQLSLEFKNGVELSVEELDQIRAAVLREFKQQFTAADHKKDKIFFLLKDGFTIMALGAVWEISPVIFRNVSYSLLGVLNVIANEKGKGYGKRVVSAIRDYMIKHDKTGIGFCMPKNQEFYKKCGFSITTDITQRFVYLNDGNRITNQDGQFIFYQDSSDEFMKKVLEHPDDEVSIPTANLW
jgi:GNAT superfamily N-acetyltransferase